MDCVQPSSLKTQPLPFKMFAGIWSIKWQDIVPDTEVLTRAIIPRMHTLLQKAQVRWEGHVTRKPDDPLPKHIMVSSATENDQLVGKRNASRTPLRRPSQASTLMLTAVARERFFNRVVKTNLFQLGVWGAL